MRTNRHALVGIPLLQLPSPLSFDLLMIVERNRRWFSTHAHRSPNFFYLVLSQAATRFAFLGDLSDATDIGLYMQFPFPARASLVWEGPGAGVGDEAPQDTHSPRPRTPVARFWKTLPPALFRHHRVCTASMPLYSNTTRQRDKCKIFSIHPAAQARRVVRVVPGAAHLVGPGREMSGGREEGLFPFSSSFPFAATGRLYFVLLVGHLPLPIARSQMSGITFDELPPNGLSCASRRASGLDCWHWAPLVRALRSLNDVHGGSGHWLPEAAYVRVAFVLQQRYRDGWPSRRVRIRVVPMER